jgi:hypothetical protein
MPTTVIKEKKPGQRACSEREAGGGLCIGHLKRWFEPDEEVLNQAGKGAEIFRCERCHALYRPAAADNSSVGLRFEPRSVSLFGGFRKMDGSREQRLAVLGLLPWKALDGISHIEFLKISYLVLTLLPFVAVIQYEVTRLPPWLRRMPLIFKLLYFSSLFLSLAHMIYQGFCPPIIKRFDSPNDLYYALLKIKSLQVKVLNTDPGFVFDIEHCRTNFQRYNLESWFARLTSSLFYIAGGGLFLIVVGMQALRLVGIFVGL